jgi:uncharacterized membrane protein YgcG
MRHIVPNSLLTALAAVLIAAPVFLRAQEATAPQSQPGIPDRAVGRLSIINGQVGVRRGEGGEWVAGIINAPLMVGDDIATTGAGSRAEIQFDSANLLRIGANAEARLAGLEYGHYTIQIAHGTVTYRVLRNSQAQAEIETPPVSVRPSGIGSYRIYVKEDGQTEITVRQGSAEIFTPKGVEQLQEGQTMLVRGNPSDPEFRIVPAIAFDDWDRWNQDRDRQLMASTSYRYVPQDVYGAEDLDQYGQWVNEPDYGYVWQPNVDQGWAPYQNGSWMWGDDYYGWTWIGYEPWGWAPFHYGRWFWGRHGWCWWPGGFGANYWSPGLVAFFGFGGPGIGFGFGNIGWVPLAPFERFYPWWGRGFSGGFWNRPAFNQVNIANVNINTYRNARVPNAIASVSAANFAQGHFSNISRVNATQIQQASLVRGQLPVAPTQASLRFSNHVLASVPHTSLNQHFFNHDPVSPVKRVPFAQQQRVMQQYSRAAANFTPRAASPSPAASAAPATGAWSRVATRPPAAGAPSSQLQPEARSYEPPTRSSGGWQRFGEPRTAPRSDMGAWNSYRPPTQNTWQPSTPNYRPYAAPAGPGYQPPQSIRIAPPIVRERSAPPPRSNAPSAPRSSAGGGGFHSSGGGGGSHGGGGHR